MRSDKNGDSPAHLDSKAAYGDSWGTSEGEGDGNGWGASDGTTKGDSHWSGHAQRADGAYRQEDGNGP